MRSLPRLAWAAALAIPLLVYLVPPRYIGSGDTVGAELLPISLLERGTLTFQQDAQGSWLPYWFHATDRGVVSNYPVLPGLLNVPAFAVARLAHRNLFADRFGISHVTAAAVAALSVLFVYGILVRLGGSRKRALAFAFVYAFATEVWSVASRGLFQHGPALLFLAAGLYCLLGRNTGTSIAAGLCLALAVLARPTAAAIVLPLVVYAATRDRRSLGRLALGAALPAILHGIYAWTYWGSPFSSAQPIGISGFSGNFLQGLAGILVSPSRGLFVFSPVFLLALPALVTALRPSSGPDRALPRALAWGVLLTILIYSLWPIWWGGHSFGYRLLLELSLPLTILLALDWSRIRSSRPARVLFAAALFASIAVQATGSYLFPSHFNDRVDQDPSRLWDIGDSELVLCFHKLIGKRDPGSKSPLARHLRPSPAPPPLWWSGILDRGMPAALDIPSPGTIVRGPLTVLGWAKPGLDDAGQVLVSLNPGARRFSPDRFLRADVGKAAPQLGDPSGSGFGLRLPPPARLEAASLLVEVRDRQGRVSRLGPVAFLWGPDRAADRRERAIPAPASQGPAR